MKDLSRRRRIADARAVQKNNGVTEAVGAFAVSSQAAGRVGPIGRFTSDAQVARHSGVAPLEASSGRMQRHRLDRGGDRQLSAALYRIAITRARVHAPAQAYGTQTQRRQEPPRSHPLPQPTARPSRDAWR
jgi:transposase